MPELPEVETIRSGLERRLVGKTITSFENLSEKQVIGSPADLVGKKITAISRQGKLLIISFQDFDMVVTIHLKMTGQLVWKGSDGADSVAGGHPEKSYLERMPGRHTRVIVGFDDGSTLYFNDLRRFGRIELLPAAQLASVPFIQKLGPEPLTPQFNVEYLAKRLTARGRTSIKAFLLDQTNIAGLGNIYADESLFRAMILPSRLAATLTAGEVRNLYDGIEETLELALLHGGSTARDYVNAAGEEGTFLRIANVYHRTGQDCNRCNTGKIERIKLAGRSTHYCPVCQR